MLWLKSFHIIAVVCWFAGLFYLPRIFVYHCDIQPNDTANYQRFCTMERRLFWGIMTPSAIATILLGLGLLHAFGAAYLQQAKWLHWKMLAVVFLVFYHIYCGMVVRKFAQERNQRSPLFYRIYNELPVFILIAATLLVVFKP